MKRKYSITLIVFSFSLGFSSCIEFEQQILTYGQLAK